MQGIATTLQSRSELVDNPAIPSSHSPTGPDMSKTKSEANKRRRVAQAGGSLEELAGFVEARAPQEGQDADRMWVPQAWVSLDEGVIPFYV